MASLFESKDSVYTTFHGRYRNVKPRFSLTLCSKSERSRKVSGHKRQAFSFRNDIKAITLELESKQGQKEIKIVLRFGNEEKNSDLAITLTDENARDKTASIETGLKSILGHNKNYN